MIRLTEKVAGRTVCVLLHGKSILSLPKNALDGKNWCYVSINDFLVTERLVEKELEVILVTSEIEIVRKCFDIATFLSRNPVNLLITTTWALGALREKSHGFVQVYRNQIILVPRLPFLSLPGSKHVARPNSATVLFLALADAGVKRIVVLGMDGCKSDLTIQQQKESYMDTSLFDIDGNRKTAIAVDTIVFNHHFKDIWKGKTCEILNCSPGSHITAVPQITHDDLVKMS